jgi:hypothetical protein
MFLVDMSDLQGDMQDSEDGGDAGHVLQDNGADVEIELAGLELEIGNAKDDLVDVEKGDLEVEAGGGDRQADGHEVELERGDVPLDVMVEERGRAPTLGEDNRFLRLELESHWLAVATWRWAGRGGRGGGLLLNVLAMTFVVVSLRILSSFRFSL